jgi:hypothetical protein
MWAVGSAERAARGGQRAERFFAQLILKIKIIIS